MPLKKCEANSKLSKDNWFLAILFIGFIVAAGSWAAIYSVEIPVLCLRSGCFDYALTLFKFPIQCIVASLALASIRGMVFRSAQTSNQIDLTIQQNTFKNYLDHKKQFMEMLKGLEEQHDVRFFHKEEFYLKLFPFNSPTHFESISRQVDSDSSILDFWRSSYNRRIVEFNTNFSLMSDDHPKGKLMARWMGCYLGELIDLHISLDHLKDTRTISEVYAGFFHSKSTVFPHDLGGFFYKISDVYKALAFYCLSFESKQEPLQSVVSFGNKINSSLDALHNGE